MLFQWIYFYFKRKNNELGIINVIVDIIKVKAKKKALECCDALEVKLDLQHPCNIIFLIIKL